MSKKIISLLVMIFTIGIMNTINISVSAQRTRVNPTLDEKVQTFLKNHQFSWNDMNVPTSDGEILHDLIVKHRYTMALEIGTSTGYSAIWIAWALSKTGGKLITIEIDEDRYKEALSHFEEAGLSEFIDARLADAHKQVSELKGPFDFIFSDADKNWYKNYFLAVDPKLQAGGCYVSHNISYRRRGHGAYLDFLLSLPNYETIVDQSGAGMAISYKKMVK